MSDSVNTRELILDILMEVTEHQSYHPTGCAEQICLSFPTGAGVYCKDQRGNIGTDAGNGYDPESVFKNKSEKNETGHP